MYCTDNKQLKVYYEGDKSMKRLKKLLKDIESDPQKENLIKAIEYTTGINLKKEDYLINDLQLGYMIQTINELRKIKTLRNWSNQIPEGEVKTSAK